MKQFLIFLLLACAPCAWAEETTIRVLGLYSGAGSISSDDYAWILARGFMAGPSSAQRAEQRVRMPDFGRTRSLSERSIAQARDLRK
jgi:hypothetical protein